MPRIAQEDNGLTDTLWWKTNIQPYKWFACSECNYNFKCEGDLKQHQWIKHDIGTGTKFPCNLCNEEFKTVNNLAKHKIYYHINNK